MSRYCHRLHVFFTNLLDSFKQSSIIQQSFSILCVEKVLHKLSSIICVVVLSVIRGGSCLSGSIPSVSGDLKEWALTSDSVCWRIALLPIVAIVLSTREIYLLSSYGRHIGCRTHLLSETLCVGWSIQKCIKRILFGIGNGISEEAVLRLQISITLMIAILHYVHDWVHVALSGWEHGQQRLQTCLAHVRIPIVVSLIACIHPRHVLISQAGCLQHMEWSNAILVIPSSEWGMHLHARTVLSEKLATFKWMLRL